MRVVTWEGGIPRADAPCVCQLTITRHLSLPPALPPQGYASQWPPMSNYPKEFGKFNISAAHPNRTSTPAGLSSLWTRRGALDPSGTSFLALLAFADPTLHTAYGAPAAVRMRESSLL
jgi:hypothetical protein